MEPLTRRAFANVVDELALLKRVEERREGAEVEPRRPDVQQVIVQSHQLGNNCADVFAPRRNFDAKQLLDRVMPRNFVGQRRDVIHPVDDGDVLIEVEMLAELFEAAVQVADIGNGFDDLFTVERQNQPQRRMRRRMLRTEIERPQVLLFRRLGGGKVGNFERHGDQLLAFSSSKCCDVNFRRA